MASKTMTFRFSEELAEEIAARAYRTGKDKTAIVVEALVKSFGLTSSTPTEMTADTLQHQLTHLQESIVHLSHQLTASYQNRLFEPDDRTLIHIAQLEQAIAALQHLNRIAPSLAAEVPPEQATAETTHLIPTNSQSAETIINDHPLVVERLRLIEQTSLQAKTLDQILSASPDLIYVVDAKGRFSYVNLTFTRVFGVERKDLLGKTTQEVAAHSNLFSELLHQMNVQHEGVFLTGQNARTEVSFATAMGTATYEYFLSPIYSGEGGINSIICTVRNLTKRQQIESALRESEAKYRNLFESANDSIFIIDATTLQILNANWNAARRLGYTRQELFQLSVHDIDMPLDKAHVTALQRALQSQGNTVYEHACRCKDGAVLPVEISIRCIEYEGKLAYLRFDRDITDRKLVEENLRQSETNYRELIQALPTALYTCDRKGRIQLYNNAAVELWGRIPNVGQDACCVSWQIYSPDGSPIALDQCPMARTLQDGQPVRGEEIVIERPDGTYRHVLPYPTPMFNADGEVIGAVNMLVDISSLKQTENALQQAHRELEERVLQRTAELSKTNAALRDSEARFRAIFEQAAVGICISELSELFIHVNQRYCDILGYTETELLGRRTFREITHPDDVEVNVELIHQLIANEIPSFSLEKRYLRKDGQIQWANVSVSIVRDSSDAPQYFICVIEDIHDRKQAEAALQESEARFRAIFEQASVGICTTTLSGEFIRVNQRYCDMLGYSEAELLKRTFQTITYPDDLEMDVKLADQLMAKEIPSYSLEQRCLHKEGRIAWVKVSVSLVCNVSGAPEHFICVIEDIHDRKQAEAALLQSEKRLRSMTNSLPACIAYVDVDRRYQFANRTYEQWFGYKPDEICGKYGWEVIGEEAYCLVEGWIDRVLAGEIVTEEAELPCPQGGSHHVSSTLVPDIGENAKVRGYYVLTTDISDRKRIEAALRQSEEQLRIIFEQAAIGITRANPSGQFLQVNQHFCDIVGYSEAELLQMTLLEITYPDDVSSNRVYSRQLWSGEVSTFSLEKRYIRKDSQVIWVEVNGSLVRDLDGVAQYSIGIVEDISDRKTSGQ